LVTLHVSYRGFVLWGICRVGVVANIMQNFYFLEGSNFLFKNNSTLIFGGVEAVWPDLA
jgi:hypothetical protein